MLLCLRVGNAVAGDAAGLECDACKSLSLPTALLQGDVKPSRTTACCRRIAGAALARTSRQPLLQDGGLARLRSCTWCAGCLCCEGCTSRCACWPGCRATHAQVRQATTTAVEMLEATTKRACAGGCRGPSECGAAQPLRGCCAAAIDQGCGAQTAAERLNRLCQRYPPALG